MKTLLLIFALSVSAFAELPNGPQYQTPKKFWVLSGIYVGSIVADGITTHQGQMQGTTEQNSWLYGQHPSNVRFFATNAAIAGGRIYFSRKLIASRRKGVRMIGWGMMLYGIEDHTNAVIRNSRIDYAKPLAPAPFDGVHRRPIVGGNL